MKGNVFSGRQRADRRREVPAARHPYTEPVVCSAHVPRLPDTAILDQLGPRPVEGGGKLWLHVPEDEGLLGETQTREGLTLATDAQLYLDLLCTVLHYDQGPEVAIAGLAEEARLDNPACPDALHSLRTHFGRERSWF